MQNFIQKIRNGKRLVALLTATVFIFFSTAAFAGETLVLGSIFFPPLSTPEGAGMVDMLYKEAFSRLGIRVEFTHVPGERSLVSANRGKIDGDILRVKGVDIERKFKNLIRVPEKIIDFEFVAFSTDVTAKMSGWEGLKPYRVAFLRGWQILHNNVKDTKEVHVINNAESLFRFLDAGRADLAIYERYEGYDIIKRHGLNRIRALEPPITEREMFLYLHKKHASLVSKITNVLRNMKEDGTFRKIADEKLGPYLGM